MKPDGFRHETVTSFKRVCVCPVWVCVSLRANAFVGSIDVHSVLLSCPPHHDPRTVYAALNSLLHLTTLMCISLNGCGEAKRHKVFTRGPAMLLQYNFNEITDSECQSLFIHWWKIKTFKLNSSPMRHTLEYCRNGLVPFRLCWHGKNSTQVNMEFAYWAKSQPSTQRKRAASCLATFYLLLWPSGHSSSSQRICRRFGFTMRFMLLVRPHEGTDQLTVT